jgi:hypothetical protein
MAKKESFGSIQGYLMSIQEPHNKSNDSICILSSSFKKKTKYIKIQNDR